MARWADITAAKATDPLPAQVGQAVNSDGKKKGPQHMPSGVRQAARELGVPEQTVRRATKIASLSPEAKAAARDHGIETQAALLDAAKAKTPAAQVEVIERRAAKAEGVKQIIPLRTLGPCPITLVHENTFQRYYEGLIYMAKRKSFENILTTDFRWPTPNDNPFIAAADPLDNANIAKDEFARLALMVDGYKSAADLMVKAASDKHSMRATLVFPIIFNYRQFLELSLKYQLSTFGAAVGIEPNWTTHKLEILWSEFLAMLEHYETKDPDEADSIVEGIILEFAKIDPGSYSYRYPVDRRGKPVPVAYSDLHLPTLAGVMQGVAGYFSGCGGYLTSLNQA